ncbi:hypothetical protein PHISCL_04545 [Aspergillus sclerotialis]|uniref:Uncharacterized protein n=1 Tax=Aspergillus sclerotialis TaxID=2070753 RepID=A0A3A2ZIX2_9EURO|nr:hypothetical protein PHISCL_04545 [Aspergillus sclerotialis]
MPDYVRDTTQIPKKQATNLITQRAIIHFDSLDAYQQNPNLEQVLYSDSERKCDKYLRRKGSHGSHALDFD